MISPPCRQTIAWSTVNKSPHVHTAGRSAISQSYLSLIASLNSLLLKLKFISFIGITVNQFEAPFSVANSTARSVLLGKDSLTCSHCIFNHSSFSLRVLACKVLISVSSGGLWACLMICRTRGPVILIDASYSCDAVLAGLTNPSPPKRTGSSKRSCSSCVVTCSVIAGTSKSAMARSSGSRKGAMSGRVLKKYVQQCLSPKTKAA